MKISSTMILRWSFEKFQSVTWSIRGREQQLHFSRESNEQGIPASVVEPGQVYAFRNVIINPVAVPPFLRVNLDAIGAACRSGYGRLRPSRSGRSCP